MSDTPLNERLNQLCKWLDEMAQSCEDISYHYQADDIRELLSVIDDLKRQLIERRTVTKKMCENAKHYWQTHSMALMTVDVFIDGMLTAALEAGEDE